MTVDVLCLFLTVPWVGLKCVIVVYRDHTHLLLYMYMYSNDRSKWPLPLDIYLNAKVSQPFNICVFFSMVHVRIFI